MGSGVAHTWGTTAAERSLTFACDRLLPEADDAYFRAVDVRAAPAVLFRWLCQLRVAPYSYDLIDNLGRRSPQVLTPGLELLEVGQRVMTIFDLVEFEPDRQLTLRVRQGRRLFGDVAVTYLIVSDVRHDEDHPDGSARQEGCRLIAKVLVCHPSGPSHALSRVGLPWGDLIMMRRQLLNLKALAEL
jgi:hypothetical protein